MTLPNSQLSATRTSVNGGYTLSISGGFSPYTIYDSSGIIITPNGSGVYSQQPQSIADSVGCGPYPIN
jgi:hypothetical protein